MDSGKQNIGNPRWNHFQRFVRSPYVFNYLIVLLVPVTASLRIGKAEANYSQFDVSYLLPLCKRNLCRLA